MSSVHIASIVHKVLTVVTSLPASHLSLGTSKMRRPWPIRPVLQPASVRLAFMTDLVLLCDHLLCELLITVN